MGISYADAHNVHVAEEIRLDKKVSVVVPVYNAREFLKECLDSLVNQTLQDIEIIAVNDGSTDDSLEILKEYETKYASKLRVFSKENGGQATARNMGIAKCEGEYIGFVDSDDYVALDMYEKMYAVAKKDGCDYVECEYKYMKVEQDKSLKELPCYGNVRAFGERKEMFIDPLVSPWNKLYRAELLKEKDIIFPEGVIYEDTAFFVKGIPHIQKMGFVPEAFVYHFLRENSTMNSNKAKRVGNIFPVLEDIWNYYEERGFKDTYFHELEYFCTKILLCSSLSRIASVRDKALRKEFIEKTMTMIKNKFPGYRRNPYLKSGKTSIYMKLMNSVTIRLMVGILGLRKH